MSKEELLLEYWRELPPEAQEQVLETARSLQTQYQEHTDEMVDGPEHLRVKSIEHLNQLLQEGLDSGAAIEVTDEWWETKRQNLLAKVRNQA
jgi:uncharacterized protein YoaH (UPF0181 family)